MRFAIVISVLPRPYSSLLNCLMESTDCKTVVTIALQPKTSPQEDADLGGTVRLLDLRAGAGDRRRLTSKTVDTGIVWEAPNIMASLAMEVAHTTSELLQQSATRCSLCPFRSFQKPGRLANHMTKYHTANNRYCPSGTKQFKVACALFDWHRIRRQSCTTLLKDSAKILRQSITPPLSPSTNIIDDDIRLVFHVDGPRYQALDSIDTSGMTRRCGHLHYTKEFATRFSEHGRQQCQRRPHQG